jgi:hypothetical protein
MGKETMQRQLDQHHEQEHRPPHFRFNPAEEEIQQAGANGQARQAEQQAAHEEVGEADALVFCRPKPAEAKPRGIAIRKAKDPGLNRVHTSIGPFPAAERHVRLEAGRR